MKGTPAIYLGRIVEKKNFRTFIYGANGERKLVNSWDEFESSMQTGIWFTTIEEAEASKTIAEDAKPKPKTRAKAKPKTEEVMDTDESDNLLTDDGSVFEVKDEF